MRQIARQQAVLPRSAQPQERKGQCRRTAWARAANERPRHTTGPGRRGSPACIPRTRRYLEVTVLGREICWDEMIHAQNDVVRASFDRICELSRRYVEIGQAVMATSIATAAAADRRLVLAEARFV